MRLTSLLNKKVTQQVLTTTIIPQLRKGPMLPVLPEVKEAPETLPIS